MLTEYKVKLKGYLEWCKTAIRFAKLSQFINLNKDVVLQHVPELINPDELKSLLKKDFNTHAANILSSASFVADVGNVNWAELAKDKQAYQAQNNHNNSDNLEVSYCTINEDGGSIVAHDTNLLQPLKEYLVKKKKGDGLHLPPLPPADTNGLQKDLFRACYVYLQMDKLTKAQEKHLQLALSAVVNTLKTDKEVNMKKYIGEITFSHLSNMIKSENFHNECVYNDKANDAVKQIFKEYEEGGIMAVRIYISEEKIKMLKAGEYDGSSVVLKIYDIFLYIFDMIQFDFQNRHSYMMSENESFARWQYVFRVLFRCTIIQW
ncbi:hypothetical protein BDB00DRAFT_271652 [Zychaea mexicana]|uniref:uncharacterized protein n=1 Tax=Zychaea mexicana TaxID=64656 RepID=UPI0022FDF785|nr:uncharacterized protein BDB00DRAFT_271652 [Zychaea mexicana]KAI9495115.1 hypothetical protein BDB00DRAFT_271652 [Zychaea mexicana]